MWRRKNTTSWKIVFWSIKTVIVLLLSYQSAHFMSDIVNIFLFTNPGIVVTNDGNAILRELDVAHPAAKAYSVFFFFFIQINVPLQVVSFNNPTNNMSYLIVACSSNICYRTYTLWAFITWLFLDICSFCMEAVNDWTKPHSRWGGRRWDNICYRPWYVLSLLWSNSISYYTVWDTKGACRSVHVHVYFFCIWMIALLCSNVKFRPPNTLVQGMQTSICNYWMSLATQCVRLIPCNKNLLLGVRHPGYFWVCCPNFTLA